MPKIKIVRPDKWLRQEKSISIFIDNKEVANIDKLKELHFDVLPGKHTVLIKNKWGAESNLLELDLNNNKDRTIKMWSAKYVFPAFLIVASIATIIYSSLRASFNIEPNSLNDMLVLIFMYLFIFVLFFRKNYLKLREVGVSKETKEDEQARLIRKLMAVDEKEVLYDVIEHNVDAENVG